MMPIRMYAADVNSMQMYTKSARRQHITLRRSDIVASIVAKT